MNKREQKHHHLHRHPHHHQVAWDDRMIGMGIEEVNHVKVRVSVDDVKELVARAVVEEVVAVVLVAVAVAAVVAVVAVVVVVVIAVQEV